MSQCSIPSHDGVEEVLSTTQVSDSSRSSVVRQGDLSPNKFELGQSDLSVSQPTASESLESEDGCEKGFPSKTHTQVFAVLPDGVRLVVESSSFKKFCDSVYDYCGKRVSDALIHVKVEVGAVPVRVSVFGAGWKLVKPFYVLEVILVSDPPATPITVDKLSHVCWNVCGRRKAPLKHTPAIVQDVLTMANMSTPLSYRQARLNVVQELVWRDLHFIATLRGKPCCLLADSTPVSDNRELTPILFHGWKTHH